MEARAPWIRQREGVSPSPHDTEGRRGLRIDDRPGGRYLGIPPQSPIVPLTITPASPKSGAGPNGTPGPGVIVILDSGSHINDKDQPPGYADG